MVWLFQCLLCLLKVVYPLVVKETKMKKICAYLFLITTLFSQQEDGNNFKDLSEHLKPFEPYIGKTFKGEFANSTPEKPIYDIVHYERALNGKAIRAVHSVNNGEYGGESIVMWDAEKESLVSWYFTTAGFYTQATMHFENGNLISIEDVTGNESGITQVKAILEFLPNGDLHNTSQDLMLGNWVAGHEIYYKEDPNAKVLFK